MLILSAEDVRRALPMKAAIEAMKRAFADLSAGRAQAPPRASLTTNDGVTLVMPGASGEAMSVKAVSVYPRNAERNLPAVHGAVLALDPETGRPTALIEGAALTAIRTGAASGAATDLLARTDARTLAVFGAGGQAAAQIEAVCAVRPIEDVRICSRSRPRAEALARSLASCRVVDSPAEALDGVDVVCTATTSAKPVFDDRDVPSGAHINAIGSFQRHTREIPEATVVRACVFVDQCEAAWEEAGELIQPVEAGVMGKEHVRGEIGQLVLGELEYEPAAGVATLFKSVGNAVQDAAAVAALVPEAGRLGLGLEVRW